MKLKTNSKRKLGRPREGKTLKKHRSIRMDNDKYKQLKKQFGSFQNAIDCLTEEFLKGELK